MINNTQSFELQAKPEIPHNPAVERRLSLALSFMEQHLSDEFSVGEVAEYASLSEDYFRRLFRRRMGISPVKFLVLQRIKAASKIMVDDPELTVRAISRQVGFNDDKYFRRMFRRYCGMTPRAYRQQTQKFSAL